MVSFSILSGAAFIDSGSLFSVNTRCIYYRIKESRKNEANITLCPILDFANHDWYHSHIQPVSDSGIRTTHPKAKEGFQFLATEHMAEVGVGKEVCLRYGGHSNQSLFVEYGFVNDVSNEEMESGKYPAEVDVQTIMVNLFEGQGTIGSWMQRILENEGYWGYYPARIVEALLANFFTGTGRCPPRRTRPLLRFV